VPVNDGVATVAVPEPPEAEKPVAVPEPPPPDQLYVIPLGVPPAYEKLKLTVLLLVPVLGMDVIAILFATETTVLFGATAVAVLLPVPVICSVYVFAPVGVDTVAEPAPPDALKLVTVAVIEPGCQTAVRFAGAATV
jgi:hypothetical protein